jgi:demethylmenaquinone methyltransferase/2-methoxy-6-polyprenyl-1,4-benzoquinol methylase
MSAEPESSSIQSLFNRIAPAYDSLNDWLSLGQHRIWKQMTVKWAAPEPGDVVLDLCCGSGDLSQRLAQVVGASGQVFGVDFSSAQLAIAQQRIANDYPPAPITWVEADVLSLPFTDNTFNAATMGYGLRNVTNISSSLQEIYRVLKSGAKAAILDFNHPPNPWIKTFQQWYLDMIVVPAAKQLGLTAEYAYIASSLERFPRGPEQVDLAKHAGFVNVVHYPIVGGTMGVLVATKP